MRYPPSLNREGDYCLDTMSTTESKVSKCSQEKESFFLLIFVIAFSKLLHIYEFSPVSFIHCASLIQFHEKLKLLDVQKMPRGGKVDASFHKKGA